MKRYLNLEICVTNLRVSTSLRPSKKNRGAPRVLDIVACKQIASQVQEEVVNESFELKQPIANVVKGDPDPEVVTPDCEFEAWGHHAAMETPPAISRFDELQELRGNEERGVVALLVHPNYSSEASVIWAHRDILEEKSYAFKTIFSARMLQDDGSVIHLWNKQYAVIRAVVAFCYSDHVSFSSEVSAAEVAVVAEEFELHQLTAICEAALCRSLTDNNLLEMLTIFSRCHLQGRLRQALHHFVERKIKHL